MVRVHLSPPPARERAKQNSQLQLLLELKTKINNCIANSKMFYYGNIIDEYERQKEIFILVSKANLVNKAQDVKSNFKALAAIIKLAECKNIEFSDKNVKTSR